MIFSDFLQNFAEISLKSVFFAEISQNFHKMILETCRFWKILKNAALIVKIGVDTAENEPLRAWFKIARLQSWINRGCATTITELVFRHVWIRRKQQWVLLFGVDTLKVHLRLGLGKSERKFYAPLFVGYSKRIKPDFNDYRADYGEAILFNIQNLWRNKRHKNFEQ